MRTSRLRSHKFQFFGSCGSCNWVKQAHNFSFRSSIYAREHPNLLGASSHANCARCACRALMLSFCLFHFDRKFIYSPTTVRSRAKKRLGIYVASPTLHYFIYENLCSLRYNRRRHRRWNFCSWQFLARLDWFCRVAALWIFLSLEWNVNEFCSCEVCLFPPRSVLRKAMIFPWKFYYVNCSFIGASLVF